MDDLLQDTTTYEKVNSNPLKKWQSKYNKQLKIILKDHPDLEKQFRAYMPALPVMYGLPKIHKVDTPMRPIISTTNSINYKLAKWISNLLSPCLNSISGAHLKNTQDFIDKIKHISFNDKIMVSFDIKSLFTKVPVTECLHFLKRKLNNLTQLNCPIPFESFIKLIELCTNDCYFVFNDIFYKQISGLPMGSPISPVLSCLFMEYFESELLPLVVDSTEIIWYRYIDDTFTLLPKNLDVKNFLDNINNLSDSIKFTYEMEQNGTLPFLDVLVIKNNYNSSPSFKVYRKPTHSNSYIHAFSNHSDNVKIATIGNIFLRAFNYCSFNFIDDEIDYIRSCFKRIGYSDFIIDKAYFKARKTFYVPRVANSNNTFKNVLVLPSFSNDINLFNFSKQLDFKLVTSTKNTLKSIFNSKIPYKTQNNCIYKVSCQDCSKVYIGESCDLPRRAYQHRYDYRNANINNAIFKHVYEENHSVPLNNDNFNIVCKISDTNKRKLIESILIQNTDNFNIHQCNFKLDQFTNNYIKSTVFQVQNVLKRCLFDNLNNDVGVT